MKNPLINNKNLKKLLALYALVFVIMTLQASSAIIKLSDTASGFNGTNLTILIFDNQTGGNVVFNQSFPNNMTNGSFNVTYKPDLIIGKYYWKDFLIDGVDLDFGTEERLRFKISCLEGTNYTISSEGDFSCSTSNGSTNQNTTLFINTTTKKVGIGTGAPTAKLDVNSTESLIARFARSASAGIIKLFENAFERLTIGFETIAGGLLSGSLENSSFVLSQNALHLVSGGGPASKGITITSQGLVGINTTKPSAVLDVAGTARIRELSNCSNIITDVNGSLKCASDSSFSCVCVDNRGAGFNESCSAGSTITNAFEGAPNESIAWCAGPGSTSGIARLDCVGKIMCSPSADTDIAVVCCG